MTAKVTPSVSAIVLENVSKRYVLGAHAPYYRFSELLTNLGRLGLDTVQRLWSRPRSQPAAPVRRDFWALKDVSFDVAPGDVVGILGRNGAGKSTLLKVLSRVTEPTTGRVGIRGRIGSLLEVGTGFHPELTGRENIYLNGAILGMSRAEIRKRFDEIVDFAEIEQFLDTPVKRYSSGMYVRLGFAIAAHLDTEILIVDEVLAVGDAAFQRKCVEKMRQSGLQGRTVLFVSHNLASMEQFCTRGIVLQRGQLVASGTIREVIARYSAETSEAESFTFRYDPPGDDQPFVRSVVIADPSGRPVTGIDIQTPLIFDIEMHVPRRTPELNLAIGVGGEWGGFLFATSSADVGISCPQGPGVYRTRATFPVPLLMPKRFLASICLYSPTTAQKYEIPFTVGPGPGFGHLVPGDRVGDFLVQCQWDEFRSQADEAAECGSQLES